MLTFKTRPAEWLNKHLGINSFMQVHALAHTLAQTTRPLLTNKHSQVWSEAFPWKLIPWK